MTRVLLQIFCILFLGVFSLAAQSGVREGQAKKLPQIDGTFGLRLGMSKAEALQKIKQEGWRLRDVGSYVFIDSYYFPEPNVRGVILSFSRRGQLQTIALDCSLEDYNPRRALSAYTGFSLIKSIESKYGHPHGISYGDTKEYGVCPKGYRHIRLKPVEGDAHSTKMSLMIAWYGRDNRGVTVAYNKRGATVYCSVSYHDNELMRE